MIEGCFLLLGIIGSTKEGGLMTVDLIKRVVDPRSVKDEEVLRKNADKRESETKRTIASRVPELSSRNEEKP